jgi:hypothetical protein
MIGNKILEKAIQKAIGKSNEDIKKYFFELNEDLKQIKKDIKFIKSNFSDKDQPKREIQ